MQRNISRSIGRSLLLSKKAQIANTTIQSRTFALSSVKLNKVPESKEEANTEEQQESAKAPLTELDLVRQPDYWMNLPKNKILDLHKTRTNVADLEGRDSVEELGALLSTAEDEEELNHIEHFYGVRDTFESDTFNEFVEENEDQELNELDLLEDEPDAGDEHSTFAQENVAEFRDQLQFNRVAAYEMPHLVKLRQEYVPPTEKEVVQYRYTTYLGESHPAERKVVLSLKVADLQLEELSAHKFKLLCGVRYDYKTDIFKMSCQKFIEPSQNASYLSDILDDLVKESNTNPKEFHDVPLDIRHIKSKIKKGKHSSNADKFKFPKEWERPIDPKDRKFDFESDARESFNKRQDSVFNLIV